MNIRSILNIVVSILTLTVFGQDTTYFDFNDNKLVSIDSCEYYELLNRDKADTNKAIVLGYFKTGQIKSESHYYPFYKKYYEGKRKEWYKNGILRRNIDYNDGKKNGQLLTYWPNGNLKRHDIYKSGELLKGKVWDTNGIETKYYNFEIMPQYPGGIKKLMRYLSKNTKYPQKMQNSGIGGRVVVSFTIETDGSVSTVSISESVNKDLDAEAVRVVKNMTEWKPGMIDGEKVRVRYNLPLKFTAH